MGYAAPVRMPNLSDSPVEHVVRDITARGVRMRVLEAGQGSPLILIHGFLVSHREYEDIIDPLARRFRVIAPDLPGFGESEKPSPTRRPDGFASGAIVARVVRAPQSRVK